MATDPVAEHIQTKGEVGECADGTFLFQLTCVGFISEKRALDFAIAMRDAVNEYMVEGQNKKVTTRTLVTEPRKQ